MDHGSAIFPPGLSHVCGSDSIVTSVGMQIGTDTAHADMDASCHILKPHSFVLFGFSVCFVRLGFSACPMVSRLLGFLASRFLVAFLGPFYPCIDRVAIEGKPWTREESTRRGRGFPPRKGWIHYLNAPNQIHPQRPKNKRKSSAHSKWRTQVVWCYFSCCLKSPRFVPLLVCKWSIFVVVPWVNQRCCLLITPAALWAARRVWPTTPCFPGRLAAVASNTVYTHVTTRWLQGKIREHHDPELQAHNGCRVSSLQQLIKTLLPVFTYRITYTMGHIMGH